METLSGHIVYLWLIPAVLFVGLPLISLLIWMGVQGIREFARPPTPAEKKEQPSHNKRKSERFAVRNMRAEISNGLGSCNGLVDNISKMGLCIKNVPESLSVSNALLSVVVTDRKETYRVVARPRWEHWSSSGVKTIGAEIASHPQNWQDFVAAAA